MDTSYPKNFFHVIEFVYGLYGLSSLWFFQMKGSLIVRVLKFSRSIVLYSCSFSFIILECIMFGETSKSFSKLITLVGMLLSTLLAVLKLTKVLLYNRKKLVEIMDSLQDENFRYESVGDFNPGKMMTDAKRRTRFVKIVCVLFSSIAFAAHISSAIAINNGPSDYRFENTTCYDFMPYIFYIPFPSDTKITCQLVAVYLDIALCGISFCHGCSDSFYVILLYCLKTNYIIVGEAFRTVRKRVFKKLNLPLDFEIFRDDEFPELEQELHREMNFMTKHFVQLLRVTEDLEDIYNVVILGQMLQCFIIFASCLYIATTVAITSPEFAPVAQYFSAVLVQLALFSWFGTGITRATEDMMNALYDSDWYSASKRFKSSLLLTMMRLQEPVHLTVGKFAPLTLNSFVSVCRGAFSYYTVLKEVNN
nr:odorant receptor [Semanotus bifasciatus]